MPKLKINTNILFLILFYKNKTIYATTNHSSNYNELASFFWKKHLTMNYAHEYSKCMFFCDYGWVSCHEKRELCKQ